MSDQASRPAAEEYVKLDQRKYLWCSRCRLWRTEFWYLYWDAGWRCKGCGKRLAKAYRAMTPHADGLPPLDPPPNGKEPLA